MRPVRFDRSYIIYYRSPVHDSVTTRIADVLTRQIVTGRLAPGARLMQDQIAETFGVSHVPVREAFRKLEAQGLLENKPRCGVRVSPLDPAAVTEVTEMRAALESLALAHAMPRMTEADLDAARRAIADGEGRPGIAVWEAANRRFHLAITEPCAMPRLMAAIRDHHRSAARFLFAAWTQMDWQPRSEKEHRAILAAVARRDVARARALLEEHIRAAGRALVARLGATVLTTDAGTRE
jgi:DNA-binding GntR family transcriptional regulator